MLFGKILSSSKRPQFQAILEILKAGLWQRLFYWFQRAFSRHVQSWQIQSTLGFFGRMESNLLHLYIGIYTKVISRILILVVLIAVWATNEKTLPSQSMCALGRPRKSAYPGWGDGGMRLRDWQIYEIPTEIYGNAPVDFSLLLLLSPEMAENKTWRTSIIQHHLCPKTPLLKLSEQDIMCWRACLAPVPATASLHLLFLLYFFHTAALLQNVIPKWHNIHQNLLQH